jgi:YfiH family protein
VTREVATMLAGRLSTAGLDWIVPDWSAPAHVGALATTRSGGVSAGPFATMNLGRNGRDDASALAENRRRLAAFLPSPPVWLDQVHGTAVAVLTRDSATLPGPVVADAAVTRERGVVCAILTADCLPVLFTDRGGAAVGIAHAGWRGLAAGVVEATIVALTALGVRREDLMAWLGPAIGPARFEVGADVRDPFCADDPGADGCFTPHGPGKWQADLYGLARRRLARGRVTRVSGGGFCTCTDTARFFSYRRERESGRMAAAVWLAREQAKPPCV